MLKFSRAFCDIRVRFKDVNFFYKHVRTFCDKSKNLDNKMRYLNVAEKNDAAKTIAGHLSRGTSRRREGCSTYNKIYEFECNVLGQNATMIMTSVSGHLLSYEFLGTYKSWQSCNPLALFDAPVAKSCPQDYVNIKKTLEREIRSCQGLIIWTDCDREGENIGFEIIGVCTAVKPGLKVYRAKFSEITAPSVRRALQSLGAPNQNVSDAVDVRQELDLRIGAAFTRFQTLRLQKVFPEQLAQSLVSYGSCQFPTLGFVVERYRAVENFVPEKFWKIKMSHVMNDLSVDFTWKRGRLYEETSCQVLHDLCCEASRATVVDVKSRNKSKWRPLPLDTIELEKLGSRKLKINAKEVMKISEKLYTQGIISYPRTETNIYPKELDLAKLVETQQGDSQWGAFARGILEGGGPTPRQGSKSDQAHPPIHPTKHVTNLSGNERKVYELIVRSFLACCSSDAQGRETVVDVDLGGEGFTGSGLVIIARNYLEVYPYDKWTAKEIHHYESGQTFEPSAVDMVPGETSPPNLLTEADLISLMEKHGIGTDATHAEHIETIKSRSYVALPDNVHFVPGLLGMGLVEGYDSMCLPHSFSKPQLRAGLEGDLRDICEGRKRPRDVLAQQIAKYKESYIKISEEANKIDSALSHRFQQTPLPTQDNQTNSSNDHPVMKCPKCGSDMMLRTKKDNTGVFISCMGYPNCKNAIWFPGVVEKVTVLNQRCPTCSTFHNMLEFHWKGRSLEPLYPSPHRGCIGGCDPNLLNVLNINGRAPPTRDVAISQDRTNRTTATRIPANNNTHSGNVRNASQRPELSGWDSGLGGSSWGTSEPHSTSRTHGNSSNSASRTHGNSSNITRDSGFTSGMGDGEEDNQVVCNCSQPAIQLTVRKDTPNYGRQFYKCAKPKESGGCNFFLWVTPPDGSSQQGTTPPQASSAPAWSGGQTSNNYSTWTNSNSSGDQPNCRCQLPAKKLTVQKEGPNKGRSFYSCPNSAATKCNYFEWADSATVADNEWGVASTSNVRGRGRGRGGRGGASQRGGGVSQRGGGAGGGRKKCGACREEGHTRNKCPRLQQ